MYANYYYLLGESLSKSHKAIWSIEHLNRLSISLKPISYNNHTYYQIKMSFCILCGTNFWQELCDRMKIIFHTVVHFSQSGLRG